MSAGHFILCQQYFIYEVETPPRMRRGLVILVDVIGIGLEKQCDAVDQPANTKEAAARDVFGSPTILIGDTMFFGNDRLDFVREHLALQEAK